jgi:hypothetical protein
MKRVVVSGFGISVLVLATALAGCGGGDSGGTGGRGGRGGSGGSGGSAGRGGTGGSTGGTTGGTMSSGGTTGGTTSTGGTGGSTGGTGGSTGGTSGSTGGTGGSTGGTGGSTGGTGGSPDAPVDTPDSGNDVPVDTGMDTPADVAEDTATDVGQADTADTAGDTAEVGDGPPAQALMVVGAVQQASDMEIQARLATKLTVDVVPEDQVTAASATGRRLVVITATASLMGTGTKFLEVTTPVMVMEPNLLFPMGMTADGATNRGTTSGGNQVTIAISTASQPLTAGLTGNVTVYTMPYRIVWGIPGTGAITAATIVGTPTQAAIFAYPTGATMVGRTAPGKRLSFFIHNNTAANVAADGFKLLDAAVDWLIAP